MIEAKLKEMMELQDMLNCQIDSDWKELNRDWTTAAVVEMAEFIDHLNWKWWKDQEEDLFQAFIEIVDVYHFVMSEMLARGLTYQGGNHPLVTTNPVAIAKYIIGGLTTLEGAGGSMQYSHIINRLNQLAESIGFTFDDIYSCYISKNALNMFRNKNGYREGSYKKYGWVGETGEDNLYLQMLVEEKSVPVAEKTYEWYYNQLEIRYNLISE